MQPTRQQPYVYRGNYHDYRPRSQNYHPEDFNMHRQSQYVHYEEVRVQQVYGGVVRNGQLPAIQNHIRDENGRAYQQDPYFLNQQQPHGNESSNYHSLSCDGNGSFPGDNFEIRPMPHSEDPYPNQTMSTEDRNGEPSREPKERNIYIYTATRVISAALIIFDCVSDWLEYNDFNVPVQSDVFLNILGTKNLEPTCTSKRENIAEKYMYFTIVGTVFAVIQIVNIVFQIVQNHRHKDGIYRYNEPKNYLSGKTEVFLSVIFEDIPQNILLYAYEGVCVPVPCEGWDFKKVKRIWNGSVALVSNVWRQRTSNTLPVISKSKSDCCDCCIKCCCPWFICCYAWKCAIPCLLGRIESKAGCSPTWHWWRCTFNGFCFKLTWCPVGEDKKWLEYGKCMNFNEDDDDSPFLGQMAGYALTLYTFIYVLNMLKYICFFADLSIFNSIIQYTIQILLSAFFGITL